MQCRRLQKEGRKTAQALPASSFYASGVNAMIREKAHTKEGVCVICANSHHLPLWFLRTAFQGAYRSAIRWGKNPLFKFGLFAERPNPRHKSDMLLLPIVQKAHDYRVRMTTKVFHISSKRNSYPGGRKNISIFFFTDWTIWIIAQLVFKTLTPDKLPRTSFTNCFTYEKEGEQLLFRTWALQASRTVRADKRA